jgi:hypothetical protein
MVLFEIIAFSTHQSLKIFDSCEILINHSSYRNNALLQNTSFFQNQKLQAIIHL